LAAKGCVHETIPSVLWTTLRRDGNLAKDADGAGYKDDGGKGIMKFSAPIASTAKYPSIGSE
jgi:hypothetical protein